MQSFVLLLLLTASIWLSVPLDAEVLATYYVFSIVITTLVASFLIRRTTSRWPKYLDDRPKYSFADSASIGLTVSTHMITGWVIFVAVGAVLGLAEVGAFRVAIQITTIIARIFATFEGVVSPLFAGDFRSGNLKAASIRHRHAVRTLLIFAGPPIVACLIFPVEILSIFGEEFLMAAVTLQIMAAGQVFNILTGPVGTMLIMAGKERVNLWLAVGGLFISVILTALLAPTWGLAGAATAIAAAQAFRTLLALYFVQGVLNPKPS